MDDVELELHAPEADLNDYSSEDEKKQTLLKRSRLLHVSPKKERLFKGAVGDCFYSLLIQITWKTRRTCRKKSNGLNRVVNESVLCVLWNSVWKTTSGPACVFVFGCFFFFCGFFWQ